MGAAHTAGKYILLCMQHCSNVLRRVIMPNWEEEYGKDAEVKPFAEFFPDASVDHQLSGFISSSAMVRREVVLGRFAQQFCRLPCQSMHPNAAYAPGLLFCAMLCGYAVCVQLPYEQENYLMQSSQGSYLDSGAGNLSTSPWGNYSPPAYRNGNFQGGYMPYQNQGDYMQQPAGGAM